MFHLEIDNLIANVQISTVQPYTIYLTEVMLQIQQSIVSVDLHLQRCQLHQVSVRSFFFAAC
jgi:hypothetical protein